MKINPQLEQLSACRLLTLLLTDRLYCISNHSYNHSDNRHYKELCSILLWKHSEAYGKYDGCKCWSMIAIESVKKHGCIPSSRKQYGLDAVMHEHIFPRNQLIEELFKLNLLSASIVKNILDRLNIGIVITVSENNRLSPTGTLDNPFCRYESAGIKIVEY